ncbi:Uncharacterised protein [Legionella beliardensis]|uniref:Uncharacterized protein n=1 Tax=Legionella beliardensis TaxID=91822 RepID=A0A378JP89_9GAMM|nr:hypothetical protein [Legionella beliardensis]STX55603.1 Uncharacterised protein [Legionella beliardensis]
MSSKEEKDEEMRRNQQEYAEFLIRFIKDLMDLLATLDVRSTPQPEQSKKQEESSRNLLSMSEMPTDSVCPNDFNLDNLDIENEINNPVENELASSENSLRFTH